MRDTVRVRFGKEFKIEIAEGDAEGIRGNCFAVCDLGSAFRRPLIVLHQAVDECRDQAVAKPVETGDHLCIVDPGPDEVFAHISDGVEPRHGGNT